MIIKSGNNYYDFDLNKQTVEEIRFYIVNPDQSVSQTPPSAEWLAAHPVTDTGGGSYVNLVISKIKEYAIRDENGIGQIHDIGTRYILVE